MQIPIVARDHQHLEKLIGNAINVFGAKCDLNHIDVSGIEDFDNLFEAYPQFNGNISQWNTVKARSMSRMFENSQFDGDISGWIVSHVTDMEYMFANSAFTGDISKWNVSRVHTMESMFMDSVFNSDISSWTTTALENTKAMFETSQFQGDLSDWDVSKVTSMSYMFFESLFNGDVSKWDVSSVLAFDEMFSLSAFSGDLSHWAWPPEAVMYNMFTDPSQVPPCMFHWHLAIEEGTPEALPHELQDFVRLHLPTASALFDTHAQQMQMLNATWIRLQPGPGPMVLALPQEPNGI